MKIPKTITIAGIDYKIKDVPPDSSELNYGVYSGSQVVQIATIFLNNTLEGDVKLETFTHEVIHAICDSIGVSQRTIEIDERFVESFSHILLQVIKQL